MSFNLTSLISIWRFCICDVFQSEKCVRDVFQLGYFVLVMHFDWWRRCSSWGCNQEDLRSGCTDCPPLHCIALHWLPTIGRRWLSEYQQPFRTPSPSCPYMTHPMSFYLPNYLLIAPTILLGSTCPTFGSVYALSTCWKMCVMWGVPVTYSMLEASKVKWHALRGSGAQGLVLQTDWEPNLIALSSPYPWIFVDRETAMLSKPD